MNNLTITHTDTVADVFRKLRAALDEEHLIDEYFSVSGPSDQPFWNLVESHRWISFPDTFPGIGGTCVPTTSNSTISL